MEIVRGSLAAHHSGDVEARAEELLAFWDPNCEYTSVMAALEPATYRGHEGMRHYLSDLGERWAEWRAEPEEVFEIGPDAVFASFRFHAVGKDSGVPVEGHLGSIFELVQGKLVRARTYPSREEALEAVGLSE